MTVLMGRRSSAIVSRVAKVALWCVLLTAAIWISGCGEDSNPANTGQNAGYPAPEQTNDGWRTASLTRLGMDSVPIVQLLDFLETDETLRLHGLVIARSGYLVLETYFPGEDVELEDQVPNSGQLTFTPREFDRDMPHFQASAIKSLVSVLVGIAIDEGNIAGVAEKLFSFFPDYSQLSNAQKNTISIEDMLTMRSGIPWDDGSYPVYDSRNDEYQLLFNPDPVGFVLAKSLVFAPGSAFEYNSGTNYLLAEIVRRKSGESPDAFADRTLFAPLQITSVRWSRSHNDSDAVFTGGLYLRPRDMAKVGQLYLDGGMWKNTRVISEGWIAASIQSAVNVPTHQTPLPDFVDRYGRQWWLATFPTGNHEAFMAAGWGGQFIIVIPDVNLVVAITAGGYLAPNFHGLLALINDYVLPAVTTP